MKGYLFFFLSIILVTTSCSHQRSGQEDSPVDTIPMMVMQIQRCSRLYSVEYPVHKIITHDDQKKLTGTFLKHNFSINLPLGKRKIAIPVDATVKAYIDFCDFSEKNVKRKGNKIEIILPDPKVVLTSSKVNHTDIKQYVAITRSHFSDEELTRYEQQGREAIIKDIPKMGIMETARESAAHTLIPLLEQMGFKEENITITFRKKFSWSDVQQLIDQTTLENGKEK